MKKTILSVTNDIATDQRINRIAKTLAEYGMDVTVVGFKRKTSKKISYQGYSSVLLWSPFQKGFMFYASYNILLFFYLLFKKVDVLVANDLDSLPANYLVSILRRKKLIYDSHELFTELPELVNRKFVKNIWLKTEQAILPNLKYCYTVCGSIARHYLKEYKVPFHVVRNVPFRKQTLGKQLKNPELQNKKIIIYQGALNIGRGIETAIKAVKFLENTALLIAGKGYFEKDLKELVKKENLQDKVIFLGSMSPQDLHRYTCMADLGFSLEEHLGLNYYYALPNKLFDYIQAKIPVLVSNLPEMAAIVNNYQIGEVAHNREPQQLAKQFYDMLHNKEKRANWNKNLPIAAQELCWENEKERLIEVYRSAGVIH